MRLMRSAGYAAFGGAMVYVLLKAIWVAGGTVGVRDLNGVSRAAWVADNAATGAIGVAGAAVALAMVRPWGRRLPLWLVVVPVWTGAGLLAPFLVLIPAAGLFQAIGWWTPPAAAPGDSAQPVLQPWVFVVVYGSFMVLGAGLAIACSGYAVTRLRAVVLGTVGQAPPGVTHVAQVPIAWGGAVLAAGLAVWRLSWAVGWHAGLLPGHRDVWLRLGDLVTAAQFAGAAAGILVLVHRWGPGRSAAPPLIASWLGAGGVLASGFLAMPTILTGDRWAPTGQSFAAHATGSFLTCLSGAAISVVALFLLIERAAAARVP
jgi:hypothetical protein